MPRLIAFVCIIATLLVAELTRAQQLENPGFESPHNALPSGGDCVGVAGTLAGRWRDNSCWIGNQDAQLTEQPGVDTRSTPLMGVPCAHCSDSELPEERISPGSRDSRRGEDPTDQEFISSQSPRSASPNESRWARDWSSHR